MSQATESVPVRQQLAAHRLLAVSALLALLATAAVVLVFTIDGVSTRTSAAAGQSIHPRVVWNGRPAESAVPATAGRPDESGIAATIGSADKSSPKAGETKVSPSIRHN